MLFNSFAFVLFLAVVLPVYYTLNHRWQNRMLVVASYLFYAAWDWRFCFLLAGSTVIDFFVAQQLARRSSQITRKRLLSISVIANLGFLASFKYYGFFLESLNDLVGVFGFDPLSGPMRVVVPVGISFYTFQTLGYTIDVYRNKIQPTRDFTTFALYVSYFPQLVAGPIERASHLLPRLTHHRHVTSEMIATGLQLMLWGYLKKIAIADAVAPYVNDIFASPGTHSSVELLMGMYLFALQIYADFSGYTDIARGVSRLLGIELMVNFRQPYLSASVVEFWRRWHISLSTWLRDYLYIPLGGNRLGQGRMYRNLMITMLLGGLWHGASWTFVIWGGLHGLYLCVEKWLWPDEARQHQRGTMSTSAGMVSRIGRVCLVFHLICLTWIFFRAESFSQAGDYFTGLLAGTTGCPLRLLATTFLYMALTLTIDLSSRLANHEAPVRPQNPWYLIGLAQALAVILISFVGASGQQAFIYFQF